MAVAFDAVGPSAAGATSAASATLSWSHTCVGDGVALVVAVAVGDSNDTGVTMTAKLDPSGANTTIPSLGALIHSGASTAGFIALFGLPNVATGAHTIEVTTSAAVDVMEGGSTSYTGADPTTAFGAQQSFTQQGTATPSITFTGSTAGNMVTAGLAHGQSITSATAGTSRWIRNVNGNSAGGNGAQADIAAGGSVTITWLAVVDWCGIAAVEVLATSGPVADTSGYLYSWVSPARSLLWSPFLQSPAVFWPPPIPVSTLWDAENGTNGVTVTQANFPFEFTPTIGTGSIFRFDTAAALRDTLGYYVKAASGFQSTGRGILAGQSTVQRMRTSFRLLVAPTSSARNIWIWRHDSGVVSRILVNSSNQLQVQDSASANTQTGPTLTVGTDYDISQLLDAGAGTLTLKVYLKDTSTQVGSTLALTGYNLGVQSISRVDLGTNDSLSVGDIEYYWDSARIESDVTTEFEPLSPGSSSATATPAVIATAAALPAPTVQTGSTVGPATVATVTALPGVTVSAGTTAQPAVIATTAAVPAPSLSTGSLVTPATVAAIAAMPSPTIQTGATAAPSSVATTVTLPAPTVSTAGNATATPATVATATSVGAPAVSTGSQVTATTVTTAAALPAPSVTAGATPTPATIATVTVLPSPSISASGNTTVTPVAVATTAAVGTAALSTGQRVTATAIATTTALPAPTVRTGSTTGPAAIATAAAVGGPALSTGVRVAATTLPTTTGLAAPTVTAETRAAPAAISTTSTVPAPPLSTGSTVAAQAIASHAVVGAVLVLTITPAVYGTAAAGQGLATSGRAGQGLASTGRAGSTEL